MNEGLGELRVSQTLFYYLSLVGESWKGEVRMQGEKTAENKANYIDGGSSGRG